MERMNKHDFEFVVSLMDGFVRQPYIIEKLNMIHSNQITGWEIWFQVEFATYLNNHTSIAEWEREKGFRTDKRKVSAKDKVIVDFVIKQKYAKKTNYIALELKQHNSMATCIKKMQEDIGKIHFALKSDTSFRSFWNIGIHQKEAIDKMNAKLKQIEHNMFRNCIKVQIIEETAFAYTIF